MLHRAINLKPDSGNASGQACGCAVRPTLWRQPLPHLWPTRTACLLLGAGALTGDVRQFARRSAALADALGRCHRPATLIQHRLL